MLQVELGKEMESRVTQQANRLGVSVDSFVRASIASQLPESTELDSETVEKRKRAAEELATFASDRNIHFELPEGMTWREYIRDACDF